MQIKTAGELRGFLTEVLTGIREGTVDSNQANAIAKVAAQINESLKTEVNTAIELQKMGGEKAVAGTMVIASDHVRDVPKLVESVSEVVAQPKPKIAVVCPPVPGRDGDKIWCDQCEMRVTTSQAVGCKSQHCKAKDAA